MRVMLSLLALAFVATSAHAASHRLVMKWETEAQLKIPESVLYDAGRKVLYVSNIDGEPWVNDGKGSIGKVGLDGRIIAVEWVTGLSAPKGLAMLGSRLYVADLTNLVVIDIEKGAIAARIAVPGSEGLNDVTLGSDDTVYVSDTRKRRSLRDQGRQAGGVPREPQGSERAAVPRRLALPAGRRGPVSGRQGSER